MASAAAAKVPAGLKQICREQIMQEIFYAITPKAELETKNKYKVLVVDPLGTRILSSAVKMSDIADAGVSHVVSLHQKREAVPQLEAIYMMTPQQDSVDALLADFHGPRKGQHLYAKAHLVFTGNLPRELLVKLSQH